MLFLQECFDNSPEEELFLNSTTDTLIGLSRSYEYYDFCLNELVYDVSCEVMDEKGKGNKSFIDTLKGIVDKILGFIGSLIVKVISVITNILNRLFNKEEHIRKAVLVQWFSAIQKATKDSSEATVDTFKKIEDENSKLYEQAESSGSTKGINTLTSKAPLAVNGIVHALSDQLREVKLKLQNVREFLYKLSKSTREKSATNAINRAAKADIRQKDNFFGAENSVKYPLVRLQKLVANLGNGAGLDQIRSVVVDVGRLVKAESHCIMCWMKYANKFLHWQHEKYSKSKGIHKVFTIPQDVRKELRDFYRQKWKHDGSDAAGDLGVRQLIVTSLGILRRAKSIRRSGGFIAGYTPGGGMKNDPGKGMSKGTYVVLSAEIVLRGSVDDIVSVFVHECAHVSDSRNQKVVDGKRQYKRNRAETYDEYRKNYKNDPQENFANGEAGRYGNKTDKLGSGEKEKQPVYAWIAHVKKAIEDLAKSINYNPERDENEDEYISKRLKHGTDENKNEKAHRVPES